MSAEENKAIVRRAWEKVINQGNLAAADEIFAADYVYHTPGSPDLHGLEEGVKQPVSMQRTAFPDIHFTVEDIIAEGDMVAHRWSAIGTHRGEFMGIPPTDSQVTMTGIVFSRISGGKVVEDWAVSDMLGLLQQLGVVPPMGREDFTWGEPMEPVTGAPGDPEGTKAIFQPVVDEVWNKGNLAVIDKIFGTNWVLHDPAWPEELRGPEGFKQYVTAMLNPFPDTHCTVEDIVAEGDKIAVRWTYAGTHQGELMGIPPTGKQVIITGITIHRFADGKIVESWFSYDMLGLMRQLGVIPPPEQGGG